MSVVGKTVTKIHVVSSLKQEADFSVSVLGLFFQLRVKPTLEASLEFLSK